MFTLLCAISIQILKFFCKDRRLLLYMSRTLHLFGTDWCAMMVPIQVIRWYRMQCYDGTDSCAIVVPIRRYCHVGYKIKKNGKDTGGSAAGTWNSASYTGMKSNLRKAQKEMRETRALARKEGHNIPQSNYETINVSY